MLKDVNIFFMMKHFEETVRYKGILFHNIG